MHTCSLSAIFLADEADCEPVCIEQVSVQVQMVDLPEMLA